MSKLVAFDTKTTAARFQAVVKSLNEFDRLEVRGVIDTLLSPTDRENCFVATYYRTGANVSSILSLGIPKDFQAISMLARGVFELAVDIRLINLIPNGFAKMIAFTEVERLKAAQRITNFTANNPTTTIGITVYDSFIKNNEAKINATRQMLWPNQKRLTHWSGLTLPERTKKLNAPFDQIYELNYAQLSWHVHSGLTSIINLQAETFIAMCGVAFNLTVQSYLEVLLTVIREFRIDKAVEKIEKKLDAAKLLPFTEGPKQADQLLKDLLE